MLTLKNKRLAYKLTIILAIILMVCVFVSLLFGFLQTNATRDSYYTQTQAEAQYLSGDLYSKLSLTNEIATNVDSPTDIQDEHWANASYIIFASENITPNTADTADTDTGDTDTGDTDTGDTDTGDTDTGDTVIDTSNANMVSQNNAARVTLSDAAFDKIKSQTATGGVYSDLFAFNKLVPSTNSNTTVYLAARKTQAEYIIVLVDINTLFAGVGHYGFDTVRLYGSDITYSVSNTDTNLSQSFYGKLDSNTKQLLAQPDSFTNTLKINGSKAVVALCPASNANPIRIIASKPTTVLDDAIRMQIRNLAIEDIAITVMFLLGFILLILLLIKDEGDFQFLNIRNGNFAIKVTSKGKIVWRNNNFGAKFDCDNISDKIDSGGKNIAYVLSLGKPIALHLEDKNGDEHYLLMSIIRFGIHYRLVGSNLTGPISTYYSLLHKDKFDSVTDLMQEWVFINKIPSIIEAGNGIKGSLALIRLTNLKMLKIMLGEHLYRQLLMLYSAGLKRELNSFGELYVLKNGDFLLLTADETTTNALINKISLTMERLRSPIKLNDNNIQLDAKLGIIVLNSNDINITANSLLSNAQRALEYAINSPKQNYYILYPTSFSVSRTNFRADGVVKGMIDNGEIEVYFQPQVSLKSNKIVGFEALCRIVGQKSTEISVGDFISIAEQYGGMIELGNYICDKAMSFAAEIGSKDMQIAVNVSPIQLLQTGFTDTFLAMYKKYNLKSGIFNIEITESAALYSFEEAVAKLTIIRKNGIGVHIDDFGVAYSSMLHLKLLPATLIKIDKSLVDDITTKADTKSIIKNIINLGKDLGLETIAEGVETTAQMDLLRDLNCDIVQGFVISRAVPVPRAKELIEIINTETDVKEVT